MLLLCQRTGMRTVSKPAALMRAKSAFSIFPPPSILIVAVYDLLGSIAIVGATGAVGTEFFHILEQRYSALPRIKALASSRSAGKRLSVGDRELVVEEGGFIYDCNAYNDDLPYYTEVHGKKWLGVPYSLEVNDTKFWRGELITPNDFFEAARSCFDMLYEEGATHPKMMSVGLHCRIIGKPGRANALRQFLKYASEKEGVWFATRLEIARWWLEHYPSE
mgnify:CR=1 FL=1